MRLIPFLLLAVPIAEIGVFILVGQWIGIGWTLAGIVLTAIVGSLLLRRQGFSTLAAIRRELDAKRLPGRELVHGLMIALAGVLLMTPGFVTDTLGFLLFVPPIRDVVWRVVRDQIKVQSSVHVFGDAARPTHGPQPGRPGRGRDGAPGVVDLDERDYTVERD